jgi:energy-coupling factor transporter transmembrane protein EcfT
MIILLLLPLIFWFHFGGDKKIFGMSNAAVGEGAVRQASTAALAIQTTMVSVSLVLFGCFYTNN